MPPARQLDHRDGGRGWLGPSHQRCNARADWGKMVASNGNRVGLEEQPYKWSQRWSDDPPPGMTVNLVASGLVEIYLGRGIWQKSPRLWLPLREVGDPQAGARSCR